MATREHHVLSCDIETYSEVDLPKCGVYAYAEHPSFEILLFAYAFDDEETQVVDLKCGERLPPRVLDALTDPAITKTAFNAAFERTCIGRCLGKRLDAAQWQCTAVQSAMLALPLSLEGVGEVLGIERKKLKEGGDLVRYFSLPCKPTKANGQRTRNLPEHAPEKWQRFKEYCVRDVDAEREIRARLQGYPIPAKEQELYRLDQEINDRGIMVDPVLVARAIECDEQYREKTTKRAYELTGLANPNSPAQLKEWLEGQGTQVDTLDKKAVRALLPGAEGDVLEVLKLRLLMAKTSVKKYEAIRRSVCADGRVHGLLQFYGANRTGRWAGRLVQIQNLPQNHIPDLALARDLVKAGRYADIEALYESTPNVLSELIRTAFVPRPGCRFIVADFSAIEARVIAWLAGEQWRLEVFEGGGDIYCASASKMFHVPVEKHGQNSHLRQKGKIAELALGYGGAVGALTAMGALEMGLAEEELPPLVRQWREGQPAHHPPLGASGERRHDRCKGKGPRAPGPAHFPLPLGDAVYHPALGQEALLRQAPHPDKSLRRRRPDLRGRRGEQEVDAHRDLRWQTHGEHRAGDRPRPAGRSHAAPARRRPRDRHARPRRSCAGSAHWPFGR